MSFARIHCHPVSASNWDCRQVFGRTRLSLKVMTKRRSSLSVKTREAFRDLRVEPSGKVTAANSYLKHNPTHTTKQTAVR